MWLARHRFWQSSQVFAVCSLILAAGFLLQMKALYHNHLRNQRLQEYKETINELSETMDTVSRVANVTNSLISTLENAVKGQKKKVRTTS